MSNAGTHMDAMYRYQRYIYDFTRKYYLLGRDRMIDALQPPSGGSILEIGCGTGRNLVRAAQIYPQVRCFGLDVSAEMLVTARASVERAGLTGRVLLAQADATRFDPDALFGKPRFQRIFISYALSMIPVWEKVVAQSSQHLATGGALHIVDFGQLEGFPGFLRTALQKWLAWFNVSPRADLAQAAAQIAAAQGLACTVEHLYGGYAVHVVLRRPSN